MTTSPMQRECRPGRYFVIIFLLLLLQPAPGRCFDEVSVESFISAFDKDGDGEIGQEEAKKLWATVMEQEAAFEGEQTVEGDEPLAEDLSMADLVHDHNLDMPFSYGGSTISSAELSEHLSHMLTGERVVAWVIHGLRLPQYAAAFQENSIDGMDFPTLISDNGSMLKDDLGVSSALHRHKVHTAIFRQIFGLGQTPGAPTNLECHASSCGSISLQWDPPANLGIPPLHKYLVQRRVASRFASWVDVGDAQEDALLDSSPDLSSGVKYAYRVQAWGGHGSSEWVTVDGCVSGEEVDKTCSVYEQGRRGVGVGKAATDKELENVRGGGDRNTGNTRDKTRDTGHDEGVTNNSSDNNDSTSNSSTDHSASRSGSSSSTGTFTSVFFVNAALLLLGFAARHSTFFHVILAAYAIAWRAVQKLLLFLAHTCLYFAGYVKEPLNLCGRLITGNNLWDSLSLRTPSMPHSSSYDSSNCSSTASSRSLLAGSFGSGQSQDFSSRAGSLASSRVRSVRPGNVPGTVAVSGPGGVVTVASGTVRTISGRTMSLEDLLSPQLLPSDSKGPASGSPLHLQGGAVSCVGELDVPRGVDGRVDGRMGSKQEAGEFVPGMPVNGLLDGVQRWSASNLTEGEAGLDGTASESSEGSSRREETAVSFPVDGEEEDDLQAVSAKYRCHAEGCRTRFDRWYTVQGLKERMHKHYCRDCQGVYCEKHTRISPHSARSQCGLDSQCLCFNCFARLPAELQLRAEKVNKLRVGPRASKGVSAGGGSSNCGNGAGSSSAAAMSKASSSVSGSSAKETAAASGAASTSAGAGVGRGTSLQEAGDTHLGVASVCESSAANVLAMPVLKSPKAVTTGGKTGGSGAGPFPKLSGLLARRHTGDRDAGETTGMRRVVSDVVQQVKPAGKVKPHHEITKSKTDVTQGSHMTLQEERHEEDFEERGQEVFENQEAGGRVGMVQESAMTVPSCVKGSSRGSGSLPDDVTAGFGRSKILDSLKPGRSLSPLPMKLTGVGHQQAALSAATSPLHSALQGKPSRMTHASFDGQDVTLSRLHGALMHQTSGAPEKSPIRRRALPAKGSDLVRSWERLSQGTEMATSNLTSTQF